MSRTAAWLWVGIAGLLGGFAGGCVPIPKGFDSPEPAARMEAAVDAADRGDRTAIPHLIGMLDSDDPATRLVAIRSLERLTGQTLGYDHAGRPGDREAAIGRWVEWWEESADAQAVASEAGGEGADG